MPGWFPCCGIEDCTGCCTDGLPDSLDVTMASGWSAPTIDSGKVGCQDSGSYDDCSDLDGQTFNLTPLAGPFINLCAQGEPAWNTDCVYFYQDISFCMTSANVGAATPTVPLYLWAWFEKVSDTTCKLKVMIEIGNTIGSPTGCSRYEWETAAFGATDCSAATFTATYQGETPTGNVDPEGYCVAASGALSIVDGG